MPCCSEVTQPSSRGFLSFSWPERWHNSRYPEAPLFAVGFSLGANLLVKYLGEEGRLGERPLTGAIAISNPWNLEDNNIGGHDRAQGFVEAIIAKIYSFALTIGLKVNRFVLSS